MVSPTWMAFAAGMLVVFGAIETIMSPSFFGAGIGSETVKLCKVRSWGKETISEMRENMVCRGTIVTKPSEAQIQIQTNPLWNILSIFFGMASGLILNGMFSKSQLSPGTLFAYLLPALYCLLGQYLGMVSSKILPSSIHGLMSGTTLLWVALLAWLFRPANEPEKAPSNFGGILIASVGIILIGYSNIAEESSIQLTALALSPELSLGCVLVLAGSLFQALAIHSEWSSLIRHPVPPLVAVGFQGLWGCLLTASLIAVLHACPGSDSGSLLSARAPIAHISGRTEILASLLGAGGGTAALSYFGAVVSGSLGSTGRAVVTSLRVAAVWAGGLLTGTEALSSASLLELAGLAALVAGAAVHGGVLALGGGGAPQSASAAATSTPAALSLRRRTLLFLNGATEAGVVYELFTMAVIVANVVCFVLSTVEGLGAGAYAAFDRLEEVSTGLFLAEYLVRFWCSADDEEFEMRSGRGERDETMTRLRWALSFYSAIDVISIAPFYLERASQWFTSTTCGAGMAYVVDLPEFQFIKILRLFRVLRVEGRFLEAFSVFDDIYAANRKLLFTSSFVGGSIWIILSAAMWAAERGNPLMEGRYDTILRASFFTLCNMFGEFPLMDERTPAGKAIAVFTAVVAAVMFGIPTGIFGNGFQQHAEKRKREMVIEEEPPAQSVKDAGAVVDKACELAQGKGPLGAVLQSLVSVSVVATTGCLVLESMESVRADMALRSVLHAVEGLSLAVLAADYAVGLVASGIDERNVGIEGRIGYIVSFYPFLDLMQLASSLTCLLLSGSLSGGVLAVLGNLRLLCLLKIKGFKAAFSIFDDIIAANKDVLAVTGFAATVSWVVFGSIMYILEKGNPELVGPDGAHYYRSIPASMWITLLNLTGEVPLCDYTMPGKVVCGLMGLVAVGTFAIPIGVLGTGFEDWVEDTYKDEGEDPAAEKLGSDKEKALEAAAQPAAQSALATDSLSFKVHEFLEGRRYGGDYFELLLFYLVFGSVAHQAIETVPSLYEAYRPLLEWLEFVMVCSFTVEYVLRAFSARHDPNLKSALGYLFSTWSLIDLLGIAPYFWTLVFPGGQVDAYDEALRMLRILRLLKMEKYIPSITLVDDVVRNNFHKLRLAGWVTAVFWIVFAALLCACERSHSVVTSDNGIAQSGRFGDMLASMPYTLVLLSGDYPLVDFTGAGQAVCLCMCVFAVGLVSVPSGIIAQGFQKEALRERERRCIKDEDNEEEVKAAPSPSYLGDGSLASRVQSLLSPDDENGQWFDRLIAALIVASVATVVAESEPSVRAAIPTAWFDSFEAWSAGIFTVEYALRIYSAPYDRRSGYSRGGYMRSFFGTADLLALLPFYLELGFARWGAAFDPAWLSVLRLLRILQLEHFTEAFTLLDDVFRACRGTLVATSFLATIIWVFSSYLFFLLERGNPAVGSAFDTLPNAMYYTAIFLSGEWGHIDFTPPGQVLCCFLVVVGLGLYAMPVAAFFDAFGEVLSKGDTAAAEGTEEGAPDKAPTAAGGDAGASRKL